MLKMRRFSATRQGIRWVTHIEKSELKTFLENQSYYSWLWLIEDE